MKIIRQVEGVARFDHVNGWVLLDELGRDRECIKDMFDGLRGLERQKIRVTVEVEALTPHRNPER